MAIDLVRHFFDMDGPRYHALLKNVVDACREIEAQAGKQVVVRVYTRADKQGGSALKDLEKVYAACSRPITNENLRKVSDVIGVTVVVQFPDQIEPTLDLIEGKLAQQNINREGARKPHRQTYFATHSVMLSKALAHRDLRCEVQCKSVLHDAWSAKMHDLTYKPHGHLDDRVKSIIESISGSLELIEQQSQIAREMIIARQRLERRPFQASLDVVYNELMRQLLAQWDVQAAKGLAPLREKLEKKRAHLQACAENDPLLTEIHSDIDTACADEATLRTAWLLAVRLAGFRPGPDGARFLEHQVERVMGRLETWVAEGNFTEREVGAVAVGFYVIQDFPRAISYAEKLLARADTLNLSPERRAILKFNKATWLVEQESLRPSKKEARAAIQAEVEQLMAEVLAVVPEDAEIMDTQGMMQIVFGTTKEEVRAGIDKCYEALKTTDAEMAEMAAAYADWHTQAGWRRYFDLAERET